MTSQVSQKPSINDAPPIEENTPPPPAFPPYPPYATVPAPPSVADTIVAGRDLRLLHKSLPKKPVRPLPKPAKPKGPAAGDLKLSRRRLRAHAQCLRKHNVVLSDRLEHMARPQRRAVMYLWRDHGHHLPPETIARMRAMLDADEPFKPAQAYEYFINQRKSNRRQKEVKVKSIKKDIQSTCGDKRHAWARNATVQFARGIQHRLSRPGSIVLTDGMLRLSNVILGEIFGFLHIKKPSRRSTHPKARFIMDISDRIAIWIDDILSEADDRMLMMDFDEDDEVEQSTVDERVLPSSVGSRSTVASSGPMTATPATSIGPTPKVSKSKVDVTTNNNKEDHFTDDFINMMGDVVLREREMTDPFNTLVDAMDKQGDRQLIKHGTFTQTFKEASHYLRNATNMDAREFDSKLLDQLCKDLSAAVGFTTPEMKETIDKCSKYLAGQAGLKNASFINNRDIKRLNKTLSVTDSSVVNNNEDNGKKIKKKNGSVVKSNENNIHETVTGSPDSASYKKNKGTLGATNSSLANNNEDIDRKLKKKNGSNKNNKHEAVTGSKSLPDIIIFNNSGIKMDTQMHLQQTKSTKEKDLALNILHKQLRSHGTEIFHKHSPTVLTHSQASDWLSKLLEKQENKIIPDAEEINILSNLFKKKLNDLVKKITPQNLLEIMQDVVVESSNKLAEKFLIENYQSSVKDALISEMQRRGKEILISINDNEEITFFAAQRLKKAKSLKLNEPDSVIASTLVKKIEEIIRCKPIARKLLGAMQEHIKDTTLYLSEHIFKPGKRRRSRRSLLQTVDIILKISKELKDTDIEAYIILLEAMDECGNAILVEGDHPFTYSDASAYLKQLVSFEDKINKSNKSLQSKIENKLKLIINNLPHSQFNKNAMKGVIQNSAKLLVSYITIQGEKTETLKLLVQLMENEDKDNVLLRHGIICKTYSDALDILRNKTIVDLDVLNSDPIVKQKIQIKLQELITKKLSEGNHLMNDVIEDVANYLAVHLIQPLSQKICLCRSIHVQCDMWSNDLVRKVSRKCCLCARSARIQEEPYQSSEKEILSQSLEPTPSRSCGTIISIKHCPAIEMKKSESMNAIPCPAKDPKCTPSYLLYNILNHSPKRKTIELKPNTRALKFRGNKYEIKETLFKDIYANRNYKYVENSLKKADSKTPDIYTPEVTNKTGITKCHTKTTDNVILKSGASDIENIYASIISTNHMPELQALLTAILWNLQIWGHWVQEIIDLAINSPVNENWAEFKERTLGEALQWRQYNRFIRQLTQSLCNKYRNTRVVLPSRVKNTNQYKNYEDIEELVRISFKWSQWMTDVIKEADCNKTSPRFNSNDLRWNYFRSSIKEYLIEWVKCCLGLKLLVDKNFRNIITDCCFQADDECPVWIISAYGVVPSGAVEAGVFDEEVVYVARTVHQNTILPAALHSSEHRCILYVDGKTVFKTKYQVMCNTKTQWLPWRAGNIDPGAVTVVPEVYIGRVCHHGSHYIGAVYTPDYRCHISVFGRPVAFNCYELLVY